jgi:tetratricopeptide (TPR) repeat protein
MRLVPLIAAIGLLSRLAFGEDVSVAAGKSPAAIKLQNDGVANLDKGDFVNARRCFDEAIRLDPTMWPAYYNRARLDRRERKWEQLLRDADAALRGKTSFTQSAILRGEAYANLGQYEAAFRDFDKVISFGGGGVAHAGALNDSAWLRATCPLARYRNGQLAVKHATMACRLTGYKDRSYIDTLAAAYAEAGDFDSAVRFEEKAMAIGASPEDMKATRKHLASFKQHRPYRDTPER